MARLAGGFQLNLDGPFTLWLIAAALAAVLFANTYLLATNTQYKWQYGLFRFIAYFAMAVLSFSTGGVAAVIPTLSSFLGMELQRLMTYLDLQIASLRSKAANIVSQFKKSEK